jgi:hypothetical protein
MKTVIGSAALVMFLAASGSCNSQTVLKREPMMMEAAPGDKSNK